MNKELKEKYTLAKNKSLKLQGQIKAINTLMSIKAEYTAGNSNF